VGTNVWGWNREADPDKQAVFEAALNLGINFFDTAEMYRFGGSEKTLGAFLPGAGEKAVIETKFFPLPWRLSKGALISALRASLDRLSLKQVDLYLIHFPAPPMPIETWVDALADAVQAGLARAVGVSNFNSSQMRRAYTVLAKRGIPLACNQVEYSLLQRSVERNGLLGLVHQMGVTLIAYCPLSRGLLTGKYTLDNPPSGLRRFRYPRAYLARIQPIINLLRQIGEAHDGKTPSQVALNWLICKGALPIPGAKNVNQVQQNAGALGWHLTEEEVATLDAASG
jgi:aryl-alcohol dehydrogenase-like predicted oxidoreductase